MCSRFLSMRRTSPGMARTLAKDRKRSWRGSAMKRETANKAKSTHHFSHQVGIKMVIKIEMLANRTIRIDRGMSACWMVLSIKLILP